MLDQEQKSKIIIQKRKQLVQMLTEEIHHRNPDDAFVKNYNTLSIESLLTIINDDKITERVIHELLNTASNIQGYHIIWSSSDDEKYKGIPTIYIKDKMIDELITYTNDDNMAIYKFVDDAMDINYIKR